MIIETDPVQHLMILITIAYMLTCLTVLLAECFAVKHNTEAVSVHVFNMQAAAMQHSVSVTSIIFILRFLLSSYRLCAMESKGAVKAVGYLAFISKLLKAVPPEACCNASLLVAFPLMPCTQGLPRTLWQGVEAGTPVPEVK